MLGFSSRGREDPNWRALLGGQQLRRQAELLASASLLASTWNTSAPLRKRVVLSQETRPGASRIAGEFGKTSAIFAGDLILALKLKIRGSQQSRLVCVCVLNGTAALLARSRTPGVVSPGFEAGSTLRGPGRVMIMVLGRAGHKAI